MRKDYFRSQNLPEKASLFEGIYHWNGKYWEKTERNEFESLCNDLLRPLELNDSIHKKVLNEFIKSLVVPDSEIDKYGEHLFCISSGVLAFENYLNPELEILVKNNAKTIDVKHECERQMETSENEEDDDYIEIEPDHISEEEWNECVEYEDPPAAPKFDESMGVFLLLHEECKNLRLTHFSNLDYKDTYDSRAIELFKKFLGRSIACFPEIEDWVYKLINSFIVGDNSGSFFVNFLGQTQCGKTTFVNFLSEILDNYSDILTKNEMKYVSSEKSFDLYKKRNSRVLFYSEPTSNPLNSTLLKEITGKTEFCFHDFKYIMQGRLIIDSNFPVTTADKSDAAFNERYVMIPFGPTIKQEERNEDLSNELKKFKSDIFSFLLKQIKPDKICANNILKGKMIDFNKDLQPISVYYENWLVLTHPVLNQRVSLDYIYEHYINSFIPWYRKKLNEITFLNISDDYFNNLVFITKKQFEKSFIFLHKNFTVDANTVYFNNLCPVPADPLTAEPIQNCKETYEKLNVRVDKELEKMKEALP